MFANTIHLNKSPFHRDQSYDAGYEIKVKNTLSKETMNPSETETHLYGSGYGCCQFMETDRLNHTQRIEEQRHKFYAKQIQTMTKMLLHNREDLINFDQALGSCNFQGFLQKKSDNI